MPMQLMLGARRGAPGDRTISAFEPWMLYGYADIFSRHSGVRFDVLSANETVAHELAAIARCYRNVCVSGSWLHTAFPSQIRTLLRERIEMLPATKSNCLASDAECVEWVYGAAILARRELAFALAQLIAEGYLDKGTALDVARAYLSENPKRIYHIE